MLEDPSHYVGPLAVTLVYLLWYYLLQVLQLVVKSRLKREYKERGEKFDRYFGNDREMLAADRYMLNMHEHMPPFLVLLWLHTVFVSPSSATIAGAAYIVARVAYPFLVGKRLGRGIKAKVLLATGTGYAVLVFFVVNLAVVMVSAV